VAAVDIMRATTTAVTAAWSGRRCVPVPSLEKAREAARALDHPLLMGEVGGAMPEGFELQNSPTSIERRNDVERPVILLSSSGTRLLHEATGADAVYAACLRNISAQVEHLARHHPRVAVIGAGTKGDFRREDQFGCARIAAGLLEAGYRARDQQTRDLVDRWRDVPVAECAGGRSADYLRRTGQLEDLEFVLTRVDDITGVFPLEMGELRRTEV
jgi:2-phosphosulfolactate phosphatase